MIRQPTSPAQAYAWWNRARRDPSVPRHEGEPECGFYRTRRGKGGPWVPCSIRLHQEIDRETGELTAPETFVCEVQGEERDPYQIWTHLRPISRREYRSLQLLALGKGGEDLIESGLYRFQYHKGGPWVPAEAEHLVFEDGKRAVHRVTILGETGRKWPDNITGREQISEEVHAALVERHRADPGMAATHKTIDLTAKAIRP